jgi:hypothetical protein
LRWSRFALFCLLAGGATSCIWYAQRVQVQSVNPAENVTVASPVKAHLKDGSTIVFTEGITIAGGVVSGKGVQYDLTLAQSANVESVPLESVAAMESFRTEVKGAESVIVSTLATAGTIVATAALAVAIFGSCPTVYSDEGNVEEAELFSSSIAPLLEGRDLDRLQAQPNSSGVLRIEIRNEAMETHYINHLQIVEVRHASDEFVLPDQQGRPIAVRNVRAPAALGDRRGRDLRATLAAADGDFYRTDRRVIEGAALADMDDWIDVDAEVPAGADSIALVFRMRNSLLSTTLLYEVMLGTAGARAIDWLGRDLAQISTAVELGVWHHRRAGMHISVLRDGVYREVVRLPDTGPISWHDVAARIPVEPGETSLRLRLSFLADHWRIDRVAVASTVGDRVTRPIQLSKVSGAGERIEADALKALQAPDDRYLQTGPGEHFFVHFETGSAPASERRTFLLSSQGYYTEWIRGSWIQNASATEPFRPTDESLLVALRRWKSSRETFEERFRNDRVPVH